MTTIVENLTGRSKENIVSVEMATKIGLYCIRYEVITIEREQETDARYLVWAKEVRFGRHESHQVGGPAFVAAAREQEQVAWSLMNKT
jgi:hypothetical protein